MYSRCVSRKLVSANRTTTFTANTANISHCSASLGLGFSAVSSPTGAFRASRTLRVRASPMALSFLSFNRTRVSLHSSANSSSSSNANTQENAKRTRAAYYEDGFCGEEVEEEFINLAQIKGNSTVIEHTDTLKGGADDKQEIAASKSGKTKVSGEGDEAPSESPSGGLPIEEVGESLPSATSTSGSAAIQKPKVPDGEILSFVDKVLSMTANAGDTKYNSTPVHKRFDKKDMRFVGDHESTVLEVQRLSARYKQQGPFITSAAKDVELMDVDKRTRRDIDRVPQMEAPYIANETSFRRLPKNFRIPLEPELQTAYPQQTILEMVYDEAHCVDHDGHNIDDEAPPIRFWKILPPNYDESKTYPHMVVLCDGNGEKADIADVMANFFERPAFRKGLEEQEWVLMAPEFAVKRSWKLAQEAVIARFCDWVCENFNVEHGRVHLFGKGYGGNAAFRTIMEQRNVAISCTGILGRPTALFRQQDRPQEKIKNIQGVHTLMYVPGRMRNQEFAYKFKFMLDNAEVRPPMRAIHFADVADHQIYYAINPDEFWNHMRFFRQYNNRMLSEEDLGYQNTMASAAAAKDSYEPAFAQWEIFSHNVEEQGVPDEKSVDEEVDREVNEKMSSARVGGAFVNIDVEVESSDHPLHEADAAAANINESRGRRN